MAQNNVSGLPSDGPGRLDVFLILHTQYRRPGDPGKGGHTGHPDCNHQVDHTGSQSGYNHNGHEQNGNGQKNIHHAHDDIVYLAAEVTGDRPQRSAGNQGDADCHCPHQKTDAGAVDQTREDVAAKLVCAEPVLRAGPQQTVRDVLLDDKGVVVRNLVSENCHQDQTDHNEQADHSQAVAAHSFPDLRRLAAPASAYGSFILIHNVPSSQRYWLLIRGSI